MRLFPLSSSPSSSSSVEKEQSDRKKTRALLYLNVYDLTPVNNYLYWFGFGIFHSGIEGMMNSCFFWLFSNSILDFECFLSSFRCYCCLIVDKFFNFEKCKGVGFRELCGRVSFSIFNCFYFLDWALQTVLFLSLVWWYAVLMFVIENNEWLNWQN